MWSVKNFPFSYAVRAVLFEKSSPNRREMTMTWDCHDCGTIHAHGHIGHHNGMGRRRSWVGAAQKAAMAGPAPSARQHFSNQVLRSTWQVCNSNQCTLAMLHTCHAASVLRHTLAMQTSTPFYLSVYHIYRFALSISYTGFNQTIQMFSIIDLFFQFFNFINIIIMLSFMVFIFMYIVL